LADEKYSEAAYMAKTRDAMARLAATGDERAR